jgi:hypothetical protein
MADIAELQDYCWNNDLIPDKYFQPFPIDLFDELPRCSPMAHMVDLVEACETKCQPAFRWAASMAWMATIAGRKIRTKCDLRTNLYILAIAGTARGKDAGLTALAAIDEASIGLNNKPMTMAFSHSDAGLLHGLKVSPSSLSVIDEIGRVLSGMMSPEAESGNRRLITAMMGLSTSAHRRFRSPRYADPTRDIEVNQPCWSLYGATTPDNFMDGMTSESLKGGMLPRTLPFIGYPNPTRSERQLAEPHKQLIEMSKAWREYVPTGNSSLLDWLEDPKPSVWEFEKDAFDLVSHQCEWWDNFAIEAESSGIQTGLLYTRAGEQMKKIALILAANRHGPTDKGIITLPDVEAGMKVVEYSIGNYARLIGNRISDTSHGRRIASIIDFVLSYGSAGVPKHLARSRFSHVNQSAWDQMIAQLLDSKQIEIREVKSNSQKGGRPSVRLVSVKFS